MRFYKNGTSKLGKSLNFLVGLELKNSIQNS